MAVICVNFASLRPALVKEERGSSSNLRAPAYEPAWTVSRASGLVPGRGALRERRRRMRVYIG
jgi:hypothetical protein